MIGLAARELAVLAAVDPRDVDPLGRGEQRRLHRERLARRQHAARGAAFFLGAAVLGFAPGLLGAGLFGLAFAGALLRGATFFFGAAFLRAATFFFGSALRTAAFFLGAAFFVFFAVGFFFVATIASRESARIIAVGGRPYKPCLLGSTCLKASLWRARVAAMVDAIETRGMVAAVRRTLRMLGVATWTPITVGWEALRSDHVARRSPHHHRSRQHAWAIGSRWVLGVDMHFVRTGPLPPRTATRPRLVVCNHRTPLDIVSLMWLFDGHFLANHKTRVAPIVGIAAIRMRTIFVDRDDRRSGAQAIRAMRRSLEDKQTIIIFPEGTTFDGDEVRPFKGGAFLAAKGVADLDIRSDRRRVSHPGPSHVNESLGSHAKRFLSRKRNPVWIAIGDPEPYPAQKDGADEDHPRARRKRDGGPGAPSAARTPTLGKGSPRARRLDRLAHERVAARLSRERAARRDPDRDAREKARGLAALGSSREEPHRVACAGPRPRDGTLDTAASALLLASCRRNARHDRARSGDGGHPRAAG